MKNEILSVSICKTGLSDLGIFNSWEVQVKERFFTRKIDLEGPCGSILMTIQEAQESAEKYLNEYCPGWKSLVGDY